MQAVLKNTPTQDLEKLVNQGAVKVDFEKHRVFRDSFWKGSFAKDSLLGWEGRVRNSVLGSGGQRAGEVFAGGSFWKRFDRVANGVASGYVVNYELAALPGLPEVRQVEYPDDSRRYFKKGDPVLLLNYRNAPYQMVYDTIKIIDDDSAIGVMHIGTFPDGLEFATFVMERNNYPFENMALEDHKAIFTDPRVTVPSPVDLEGRWEGHLIFLNTPDTSLLNQVSPVAFQVSFHSQAGQTEARYRIGLVTRDSPVNYTGEFVQVGDAAKFQAEIRSIDRDTLIGRWLSPTFGPVLSSGLKQFIELQNERLILRFVLKRAAGQP